MIGNTFREDGGVACAKCGQVQDYAGVYAVFVDNYDAAPAGEFDLPCGCGGSTLVTIELVPQFSTRPPASTPG